MSILRTSLSFVITAILLCLIEIPIKYNSSISSFIDTLDFKKERLDSPVDLDISLERNKFLNNLVDESIDMAKFKHFAKDLKEPGIYSLFVPQNFVNVTCEYPVIKFAEKPMPVIALASYPGSGNTWYRHLIEYISGIATSALKCGLPGVKEVFIGNCGKHTKRTIVRKVHLINHLDEFEKGILLLRNPFDAILAEFNRRHGGKTGFASPELFKTEDWTKFVKRCAKAWLWLANHWIFDFERPLHISFYENMVTNFHQELFHIAKFLGVNVTFRDLWCAKQNQEGQFHRKKPAWQLVESVYSEQSKDLLKMTIFDFRGTFEFKYGNNNIPF